MAKQLVSRDGRLRSAMFGGVKRLISANASDPCVLCCGDGGGPPEQATSCAGVPVCPAYELHAHVSGVAGSYANTFPGFVCSCTLPTDWECDIACSNSLGGQLWTDALAASAGTGSGGTCVPGETGIGSSQPFEFAVSCQVLRGLAYWVAVVQMPHSCYWPSQNIWGRTVIQYWKPLYVTDVDPAGSYTFRQVLLAGSNVTISSGGSLVIS